MTANFFDQMNNLPFDYYSSPWEHEADFYGGVTRGSFKDEWTDEDGYFRYVFK